jgi:hypothetical protein
LPLSFSEYLINEGFVPRVDEQGRITYGGMGRLVPKRQLRMALIELEDRLSVVRSPEEHTRQYGEFYQWLFNAWAFNLSGGSHAWVSKEPDYGANCDFLLDLVPNARLLVICRDPRDVALSSVKAGFSPNIEHALNDWAQKATVTLSKLHDIPHDRWMILRFEDLVAKFEPSIRRISEFFDITPNNDELGPVPDPKRVDVWKRRFTNHERVLFRETCAEAAAELGYA